MCLPHLSKTPLKCHQSWLCNPSDTAFPIFIVKYCVKKRLSISQGFVYTIALIHGLAEGFVFVVKFLAHARILRALACKQEPNSRLFVGQAVIASLIDTSSYVEWGLLDNDMSNRARVSK